MSIIPEDQVKLEFLEMDPILFFLAIQSPHLQAHLPVSVLLQELLMHPQAQRLAVQALAREDISAQRQMPILPEERISVEIMF